MGCGSDWVTVHYYGTMTVPTSGIYYLRNVADDGFWMTLDGALVIPEWRDKGCSGNWYPVNLQAGHAYALDAWYYENGGGACSTLYYSGNANSGVVPSNWFGQTATTTTMHDPSLLIVLQDKQTILTQATADLDAAQIAQSEAAVRLTNALDAIPALQQAVDQAQALVDAENARILAEQQAAAQAEADRLAALAAEQAAQATPTPTPSQIIVIIEPTPTPTVQPTKEPTVEPTTSVSPSTQPTPTPTKTTEPTKEPTKIVIQPTPTPKPTKIPEPAPEPAIIVAESLSKIADITAIAPENITAEQATELIAAANAVFESVPEGSTQYNQALEALAIAAQADDPKLPAALEAIPGAVQVLQVFNNLGNVGADMAPKTREKAKKTVIASVIAAGAAVSAVATASTASSSGGGTSSRRNK